MTGSRSVGAMRTLGRAAQGGEFDAGARGLSTGAQRDRGQHRAVRGSDHREERDVHEGQPGGGEAAEEEGELVRGEG